MTKLSIAVAVLALATVAHADPVPRYPAPALGDGEILLTGVFPPTVQWLADDGTPVTFQAISIAHGKHKQIVLRATAGTTSQDIATSDLPEAELSVFDHENGQTVGLQLHRYIAGPDLYEGWVVKWTGKKFEIARTTRFNGKQPQPHWLVDSADIPYKARVRTAMQVMRWGAHRADANAFGHFFDDQPVKVTWRAGTTAPQDETVAGTDLVARLAKQGLPLVGHGATCKALCCTADTKALGAWRRVANVCFDAEPADVLAFPHVRSIEIVAP